MKAWLLAAAVSLTALGALSSAALAAEGPRPASENRWPGMTETDPATGTPAAVATPAAAPHYVWEEGYESGGKWHGHWVLLP